ncbi:TniQ family protein [Maritalea mobilis]|uniref:TniQ family protein n=1 Tax=Maritalea mobilis TaxID=483324 RepID=UPI001C97ECAC|nr:TniQ family protein [Maritalea mobilis]MBY6202841.1 TniQ family protein [Maritalea mobilis]
MTLWPRLSIDPEETLLSYADRLGLMHTGRGMERLLADLGIRRDHFVSGRGEAVLRLAEATGQAVEVLQNMAIRVFQRCASFRGEDVSKTFLSPRAGRYCPVCLAEDGPEAERRHRLLWGFRHVSRCDRHGVMLADAPIKDATSLRVALAGAPLAAPTEADDETPEYLVWLRERIHGESLCRETWLNEQTIEQVFAASEMLGGILEHGHGVSVTKLSPAQTEAATDIGFSIYREGPGAIEEALDTIRSMSPAKAVQAGPLAYYGKLHDWLDRRSNFIDPGPIKDILRDHIVKHSAVAPGETVLGVEIAHRRFHTLQSLSSEVGIERPRLSRLLRKIGEIPEAATELDSGNMVFEVARTVPLIEAFKTAVPLSAVPAYIGASKRQVEILYRAGILKPLVPSKSRGSVRNVVFARTHLDEFLDKLAGFPDLPVLASPDLHPIAYACQHGAGPFEEVFEGILNGRIRCFRHPDKAGIRSIYVDAKAFSRTRATA